MKLLFRINGKNPDPYFGVVEGYILEGINQVSHIELILVSKIDLSEAECMNYIGSSVTLALADTPTDEILLSRFDGIIYEMHSLELARFNSHDFKYQMIVRPKLWELNFKVQSRAFPDKTRIEVISEVFKEWNLIEDRDYMIERFKENGSTYPKVTQIIQNQVSDLVFVQNLMQEAGINYYFFTDKKGEVPEFVCLFDHNGFLGEPYNLLKNSPTEDGAVPYCPSNGLVTSVTYKYKVESLERHYRASIMDVQSYVNFGDGCRQAFASDLTSVENGYAGCFVSYGCAGESREIANQAAQMRSEYLKSNQVSYEGSSNFYLFRPGEKYPIGDEFGKVRSNKIDILLTTVFHHFRQTVASAYTGEQEIEYSNIFYAVNKDAPIRPDQTSQKSMVEMKRAFSKRHAACIANEPVSNSETRSDMENVEIHSLKQQIAALTNALAIARDLSGIMVGEVIKDAWVSEHKELLCRVANERFPEGITVKVALGWRAPGGWLSLLPRVGAQVYFQFFNGEGGQNEAILIGYRSTEAFCLMDPAKTTDAVTLSTGDVPELGTSTEKVVGKSKFSPKNKYRNNLLGEKGTAEVAVIDGGEDSVYLHANKRVCVVGDGSVNISAGTLCEKAGTAAMQFDSLSRGVAHNEKISIGENQETTVYGSMKMYSNNDISMEADRGDVEVLAKNKLIFHNKKNSSLLIDNDTVAMGEESGTVVGITPGRVMCSPDSSILLTLVTKDKEATIAVDKSKVVVGEKDVSISTEHSQALFGENGAAINTDKAISIEDGGGASLTMCDGEIRLNC